MTSPAPDHDVIFYDGQCPLCQRQVLFVLRHDARSHFRFACLDGDLFRTVATQAQGQNLTDTMVVRRMDGALLVRSSAALYILQRLRGFWALPGRAGWLIPRPLRDALYRWVARRRHRLAAAAPGACPTIPPQWRGRFMA